MYDLNRAQNFGATSFAAVVHTAGADRRRAFHVFKRGFDILGALVLMPVLLVTGLILLLANPFLNRGRLFYVQERMGQHCHPFRAWKFRSMTEAQVVMRGSFDALEHHRITALGRILRRARLDELPQIINVLRGEMSLIGPRPDYLPHAQDYLALVPGYRERHAMRPGISGYAQVAVGYVDGIEGVRHKVAADLDYIAHAGVRFDLWIVWRTFLVVVLRKGV